MYPERWNEPPTYGIEDPQQIPEICKCSYCGGEIYPGDDAFTDGGKVRLHEDCLLDWVRDLGVAAVAEHYGFEKMEITDNAGPDPDAFYDSRLD